LILRGAKVGIFLRIPKDIIEIIKEELSGTVRLKNFLIVVKDTNQKKKTLFLPSQSLTHTHTHAHFARMAELVDALVSGTSIRKDVQVRVLFRAQAIN
jgi:hypothetical protein